jgi:hypothetical protein
LNSVWIFAPLDSSVLRTTAEVVSGLHKGSQITYHRWAQRAIPSRHLLPQLSACFCGSNVLQKFAVMRASRVGMDYWQTHQTDAYAQHQPTYKSCPSVHLERPWLLCFVGLSQIVSSIATWTRNVSWWMEGKSCKSMSAGMI